MEALKKPNNQNNEEGRNLQLTLKSATPLTALQLNSYKLDIKHTILTPQLLENLSKE